MTNYSSLSNPTRILLESRCGQTLVDKKSQGINIKRLKLKCTKLTKCINLLTYPQSLPTF